MYDLHVPKAAYEKQIALQESQISAVEANRDMVGLRCIRYEAFFCWK